MSIASTEHSTGKTQEVTVSWNVCHRLVLSCALTRGGQSMRLLTLIAALAISSSAAIAQTPAVKSPSANNPAAPVPGANSFTEGQAKSKIEASGFTNVSALKKDENGVWTGSATKGGKKVNVKLDFQGNVVTQ
jgi:hypothetical protein